MGGKKRIVVIGINTFGRALMRALLEHGLEFLGLDLNRERVQQAAAEFPAVIEADATSEAALTAAGVREYDMAVVALASDLATSILATLTLKELGVATVVAKARNQKHAEALRRVGADITILPESDSAERLAQMLLFGGLADIRVITEGFSLAKVAPLPSLVGVAVRQAFLRSRYRLNIVLIEHANGKKSVPDADYLLSHDDVLYVAGWERALGEYSRALDEELGKHKRS